MNYNINLELDNITKAIKDIERYERAIEIGYEKGVQEMEERILNNLIEQIASMGLNDSDLSKDIYVERATFGKDMGVMVGVANDYAKFIEFGTGLAGLDSPHPNPNEPWEYNVGATIRPDGGWWYPTDSSDPNPHKHEFNGRLYAWTLQGQPSRPFVYNTWKKTRQGFTKVIEKHVNAEISKLRKGK